MNIGITGTVEKCHPFQMSLLDRTVSDWEIMTSELATESRIHVITLFVRIQALSKLIQFQRRLTA